MSGTLLWLKKFSAPQRDDLRALGALMPYDRIGVEDFADLSWNAALKVRVWQPRNPQLSHLYWAIVSRIARGMGKDKDDVSDFLKVATGHCRTFHTEKHGAVSVPKSIAEDKCDEQEFRRFFDNCLPVIYGDLGIEPAAIADLLKGQR